MTAIALSRPAGSPRRRLRRSGARVGMTLVAVAVLGAFLMPLLYMAVTSLKDQAQITDSSAPFYPVTQRAFEYEGQPLPVYVVPLDGGARELAIVRKGREDSDFVDPANPAAGIINWQGRWRTLDPAYSVDPKTENFAKVWEEIDFPKLLRNTLVIALVSTIGAVASAIVVAYGFSRFRFRFRGGLFIVLLATIMLSQQATLVPSYIIYSRIGWAGTWLPLIVPHFFANAYNVFLLRQYFMTIPRDLDEAAMIDGASPFRVLRSVIVPQAIPAIVAVSLFHFFYAWNEFLLALVYVGGVPDLWPLTLGIQQYAALYVTRVPLVQASAILTIAVPVVVFFLAQRAFMRGVVITGVEK
ncbi:MAG TPA: carbohydrate ABC transporter permease [Candidatus Limnocylindrales bacterium]|jgi:multiple sugar transport system permease protein